MSKTLLHTRSIKNYVVQLFEHKTTNNSERTISIEYTDPIKLTVEEILNFKSNYTLDSNGIVEHIYESIYNYYLIKIKPPFESRTKFTDKYLEDAFRFIADGYLYHIEGSNFYFKGEFTYDDTIFDTGDLEVVKSGSGHLLVKVNDIEGAVIFWAEPDVFQSAITKELYCKERYSVDIGDIYKALRKYSTLNTSPQTIFDKITKDLL
jgi:hypothetical protein